MLRLIFALCVAEIWVSDMNANSFREGHKFQHKQSLEIWKVSRLKIDGLEQNYFENENWGDITENLDEDLFIDLNYYKEAR